MTLYELTGQYLLLLQMAEDPEVDPEVLSDTMEGLSGEIEEKADGYAKVMKTLEGESETIKKEIDRLTARRNSIDSNIARIKNSLESAMRTTGNTKFKTDFFSFNIQKNPPSLDVIDDTKVPKQFFVPQPDKLDRKSALAYIKEHGDQEWGAIKQGESLRIR